MQDDKINAADITFQDWVASYVALNVKEKISPHLTPGENLVLRQTYKLLTMVNLCAPSAKIDHVIKNGVHSQKENLNDKART